MDSDKNISSQNKNGIFKDCHILILPAGLGKKRMTLFQTQIINNGGVYVTTVFSNSDVTHIVVEDSFLKDPDKCYKLLQSMHVEDNTTVKVVGTQWLSKCLKDRICVDTKEFEVPFRTKKVEGVSNMEDPVPDLENTKEEINAEKSDVNKQPVFTLEHSPPKKLKQELTEKFACSQPSSKVGAKAHCNGLVIAELQKLSDAFRSNGDQWRAYGYEKAISALRTYGKEITSFEEAKSIPGVGEKMAGKIIEFLNSGQLRKVNEICGSQKNQVVEMYTKVWGAGPSTAQSWYQQGFRTLDDLKTKANLTKQQKIGLKYFEDFQERMSREEVEQIGAEVKKAALGVEPTLKAELCGSYRRGKQTCGDVDVMLSKTDSIPSDILAHLILQLKESGFITDDLVNIEVNKSHMKYLGVFRLHGENKKHRRLDIFVVPLAEYATALMHYTGSALFNRSIRLLASRKGMSLSEHSLVAGIVRQGKDKLNEGYVLPTPTEESIFKHLELEYRPPEERDH